MENCDNWANLLLSFSSLKWLCERSNTSQSGCYQYKLPSEPSLFHLWGHAWSHSLPASTWTLIKYTHEEARAPQSHGTESHPRRLRRPKWPNKPLSTASSSYWWRRGQCQTGYSSTSFQYFLFWGNVCFYSIASVKTTTVLGLVEKNKKSRNILKDK